MVNVISNVKMSSSGNVPITGTLQKGYMSFGNFGGENKLYGNIGSDVVDLIGDAKTVLYFQNQSELDTFLQGTDVPVGEWYAAVAEKVYVEQRYIQFDLSTELPLGNYVNSIVFSNKQGSNNFGWWISVPDSNSSIINLDTGTGSDDLKITVDAWVHKPGALQFTPPRMDVNIVDTSSSTNTQSIDGVYDSSSKLIKWQGSFVINNAGEIQTRAPEWSVELWAAIMRYQESDSPILNGTIKFEVA